MPNLNRMKIWETSNPEAVLACIHEAQKHFSKPMLFDNRADRLTVDFEIKAFSHIDLDTLVRHTKQKVRYSGFSADGIRYTIHKRDRNQHALVGSVMNLSCPNYWQILMQLDDQVLVKRFGEYDPKGRKTEILNM